MRHGRRDYQRIQDPAANRDLITAFEAATRVLRDFELPAGTPKELALGKALLELHQELRATIQPVLFDPPANPIRVDEPVFLLRAGDRLAPSVVREYARQFRQSLASGPTFWKQSDSILDVAIGMEEWQIKHGWKLPDVPLELQTADATGSHE